MTENTSEESIVQNLNSYFEKCEEIQICNGTVFVVENGKTIFNKTMGISGVTPEKKLSNDHQFDIGSITKQFAAAAIMRLNDKGLLSFDDDLRSHLPDLPYEGITLRHLLNHTSGLPEAFGYYTQLYRSGQVNDNITNDHLLSVLVKERIPMVSKPGEKWSYNNTGYALLASVVEKVSSQSFAEFLEDEFFTPLNMQDTVLRQPATEAEIKDRAYGFKLAEDGNLRPYDQIPFFYIAGSGGIYSTSADLHLWERALSAGHLVSDKSWNEAIKPAKLLDGSEYPYGFGWSLKPSEMGEARIAHGGHWRGFRAALEMFPSKDRSIIMLTNNGADDSVDQAIDDIEAMLDGQPAPTLSVATAEE
jgi:CubicO group peptidase (beta-lactamase class C family)